MALRGGELALDLDEGDHLVAARVLAVVGHEAVQRAREGQREGREERHRGDDDRREARGDRVLPRPREEGARDDLAEEEDGRHAQEDRRPARRDRVQEEGQRLVRERVHEEQRH